MRGCFLKRCSTDRQGIAAQCPRGWIARTGAPWRDLPRGFGNWNTVYRRFRDWARAGVFDRIFSALSEEPDMEMAMVDATIVKVHRAGQGSKGGLSVRL